MRVYRLKMIQHWQQRRWNQQVRGFGVAKGMDSVIVGARAVVVVAAAAAAVVDVAVVANDRASAAWVQQTGLEDRKSDKLERALRRPSRLEVLEFEAMCSGCSRRR